MTKIKTDTLIGHPLNWAVAKCIGGTIRIDTGVFLNQGDGYEYFTPSTELDQGGPIIDREGIEVSKVGCEWYARINPDIISFTNEKFHGWGETMLIAAMRCFVASKLGDEIEIPEVLV